MISPWFVYGITDLFSLVPCPCVALVFAGAAEAPAVSLVSHFAGPDWLDLDKEYQGHVALPWLGRCSPLGNDWLKLGARAGRFADCKRDDRRV